MIFLLKFLSVASLVVVLAAPLAYAANWISMPLMHHALLGATILWFLCAPPWLWEGKK